jgi:hypothetical protein
VTSLHRGGASVLLLGITTGCLVASALAKGWFFQRSPSLDCGRRNPRATSVPDLPMAIPTSAARNAGASFTPSLVTATISRSRCSAVTTRSFWSAVTRAQTISGASTAS